VLTVCLFDRYVAVDWSANNEPKLGKDSIWSGVALRASTDVATKNHRTRRAAEAWLLDLLRTAVDAGERVLVGLDFPYGYPAGFAAMLGVAGEPWRGVWAYLDRCIEDDERNVSNRFQVASDINARLGRSAPFWGRPAHLDLASVPAKKEVSYLGAEEAGGLGEWRLVERHLRDSGMTPQPVWKLTYAGSVGSQSLLGVPVLHRLRYHHRLREASRTWPFEVGAPDLPAGEPAIIHAEIWPTIVPFSHQDGSCRDEQQVRAIVERWRELDREHRLGGWFATPNDPRVKHEEGWVLGVPAAMSQDGLDPSFAGSAAPQKRRRRTRPTPANRAADRTPCLCGCGNYPRGRHSRFMPGHDQRRNPATGKPFNAA
jgi:precorrin-8X/cobalt-precorrin-8 methylmutase